MPAAGKGWRAEEGVREYSCQAGQRMGGRVGFGAPKTDPKVFDEKPGEGGVLKKCSRGTPRGYPRRFGGPKNGSKVLDE
jgi:hypothetical protein